MEAIIRRKNIIVFWRSKERPPAKNVDGKTTKETKLRKRDKTWKKSRNGKRKLKMESARLEIENAKDREVKERGNRKWREESP